MNTRKRKNQINDQEQLSNNTLYDEKYKGFVLGRGLMTAASVDNPYKPKRTHQKKAGSNFFKDESNHLIKIHTLRKRQRDMGLMTPSGDLYDPRTNNWVDANIREESSIFDDINYFENYPALKKGLPTNAPTAPTAQGIALE